MSSSHSIFFQNIQRQLPDSLHMRFLNVDDFSRGYPELISQLTKSKNPQQMDIVDFQRAFYKMKKTDNHHIIVIEDVDNHCVVGTGTIFIEQKFIHNCGKVGHIEDIVVDINYRKLRVGLLIVQQLLHIGKARGVYKCILNCTEDVLSFYEKLGFQNETMGMTFRMK